MKLKLGKVLLRWFLKKNFLKNTSRFVISGLFPILLFASDFSLAQINSTFQNQTDTSMNQDNDTPKTPVNIKVQPHAEDVEISNRIRNILESTQWFIKPKVEVQNGVVFLYGKTKEQEYRKWAEELASKTQDTAAVVNHIEVIQPNVFEFQPILLRFENQWKKIIRMVPSFLMAIIILILSWYVAKLIAFLAKKTVLLRLNNSLLQTIASWAIHLGIFLIGLYLLFYLMGLTGIALTVIGGTGLLGIILGIAFKEITENLLASIFLSIYNPFNIDDLVEINDIIGFIQGMTLRSTILINLEGNYIQIPNATVYKSSIRNFSSNPNRRECFSIGIGYECNIAHAQEVGLNVLKKHPAVLKNPEPMILVDNLGKATINLNIYFWLDGNKYSWLKVRSSVIRLIKKSFQESHISMPDSEREVIFPQGVCVKFAKEENVVATKKSHIKKDSHAITTEAEGQLKSAAKEIETQAKHSRSPESGENLLQDGKPNG